MSNELASASPPERFFTRVDWAAFWTALTTSFLVYFYTMAPTVTLEDSGELAVAGDHLGVPHPPGYPIWTIICWIFRHIFAFVPYRGYPNPAWAIALVSVVFGALAIAVTAMLISRSGADLLDCLNRDRKERGDADDSDATRSNNLICYIAGVTGSLLFAFSPVMWSQSVIVEVYSLNAFFLIIMFLLCYRWMRRPTNSLLYTTAFIFGLGLTNYQVLLLTGICLILIIMMRDLNLFRDFLIMGSIFILAIGIIKLASMGQMIHFTKHPLYKVVTPGNYGAIIATGFFLILAALCMNRGKINPGLPIALYAAGAIVMLWMVGRIETAPALVTPPGQTADTFSWAKPSLIFVVLVGILVVMCCFTPRGARIMLIGLAVLIPMAILLKKGALYSVLHPTDAWFWFYMLLNAVLLTTSWYCLPNGKTVALTILCAEVGVGFYLYMPIVSDLRNPPMNWGHPVTWEGFKHAVTRGQYEKITPSDIFSSRYLEQVGFYLTDLRRQFTLLIAPLGFLPFVMWRVDVAGFRFKALNVSIILAFAAAVFVMIDKLTGGISIVEDVYRTLLAVILILLALGTTLVGLNILREFWQKAFGKEPTPLGERVTAALPLLGVAGAALLFAGMIGSKLIDNELKLAPSESFGMLMIIVLPTVAIGLMIWLMIKQKAFKPTIDSQWQHWLLVTVAGFFMLGLVLISLANLKGDVQDTFIQRVKFIMSHAFYALWVGYGLILGLAYVIRVLRNRLVLQYGAFAFTALLPLIPIHQNYFNSDLVREMGGAEQQGHDFGWQFGKYQLTGADGISEELDPEEEPLPNPEFPKPMGPNAVFYGGTDPGRFVPTYMIYSADVREDVYLITQNALADNTFMSVTRDLYGDDIWIPSAKDNASAFSKYVDDVRSGRMAPSAALKIQNGRVSVHGVAGVMIINGILAKMIFDHNIFRHNFYVEESYVINWMYPYLIPHGLIMQIWKEPMKGLTTEMVNNDLEFWDWYTRRLTTDTGFLRDVVARKSFSKLRSAIGGVYVTRGLFSQAEDAFREALKLYPSSPEANFRMAGDVYLRRQLFKQAKDTMLRFQELDPKNGRIQGFINQISDNATTVNRVLELQKVLQSGTRDINKAFELADLYRKMGDTRRYLNLMNKIIGDPNVPPEVAFKIGQMHSAAKHPEEMDAAFERCLLRTASNIPPPNLLMMAEMYAKGGNIPKARDRLLHYLKFRPDDVMQRINLALMHLALQNVDAAYVTLEHAVRLGGDSARNMIKKDQRFASIQQTPRLQKILNSKVSLF